jgi:hypothetical protein
MHYRYFLCQVGSVLSMVMWEIILQEGIKEGSVAFESE